MNYQAQPDIPSEGPLLVDHVVLFQRFRQETDMQRLAAMEKAEFQKHLQLCELAILNAARGRWWCELPEHPWFDVNIWVHRHLADVCGFEIVHEKRPQGHSAPHRLITVVKWADAEPKSPEAVQEEWRRRSALEDVELTRMTLSRKSRDIAGSIESREAIWAAEVQTGFVAEVQRVLHRNLLCVFDSIGRCIHRKETAVAFSALFGPDVADVEAWQKRARAIIRSVQVSRTQTRTRRK